MRECPFLKETGYGGSEGIAQGEKYAAGFPQSLTYHKKSRSHLSWLRRYLCHIYFLRSRIILSMVTASSAVE